MDHQPTIAGQPSPPDTRHVDHQPPAASPLRQVLDAYQQGALTRAEVVRRTGLSADLVDAVADHLIRSRLLAPLPLSSACPASGCGGCANSGCQVAR